jgi:hypothetical protein
MAQHIQAEDRNVWGSIPDIPLTENRGENAKAKSFN